MEPYYQLPDVFQIWKIGPNIVSPDGPVSFPLSDFSATETLLWRWDLPADPQEASATVAIAENQLLNSAITLDKVPERIDKLLLYFDSSKRTGISFDASSTTGTMEDLASEPERELITWMEAFRVERYSFGFLIFYLVHHK